MGIKYTCDICTKDMSNEQKEISYEVEAPVELPFHGKLFGCLKIREESSPGRAKTLITCDHCLIHFIDSFRERLIEDIERVDNVHMELVNKEN